MNLVIDASVIVKAFIPENGSEEAGSLLARAEAARLFADYMDRYQAATGK